MGADGSDSVKTPDSDENRAVPPYDKSSTTAAGIYPLEKMFAVEEVEAMNKAANVLVRVGKDKIAELRLQRTHSKLLLRVLEEAQSKEKLRRVKLALLAQHLTAFLKIAKERRYVLNSSLLFFFHDLPSILPVAAAEQRSPSAPVSS